MPHDGKPATRAPGIEVRGTRGATIRPLPSPAKSACKTARNGTARRVLGAGLANTSCGIGRREHLPQLGRRITMFGQVARQRVAILLYLTAQHRALCLP